MRKEMFNWLLELKLKITIVEINAVWGGKGFCFAYIVTNNYCKDGWYFISSSMCLHVQRKVEMGNKQMTLSYFNNLGEIVL